MKKSMIFNLGAALAMGVASFAATTAPAEARDRDHWGRHYDRGDSYRGYRNYRGNYYRGDRGYRTSYRGDRYYRGNDYYRGGYRASYRCRDSGAGGTVIGAIAGGLLGNQVSRYGNKTEGAIIGAGVGALAGRAIDRGDRRC